MEVQSAFAGAASAAAAALGMGDAFHIDDLLDFSNEDIAGPIGEGFPLSSLDSTVTTAAAENVSGTSLGAPLTGSKHLLDAGPDDHSADVLCVPCDDLAELEWLSKFVEDSFSMGETPTRVCNDLAVSCEDMQFESSYSSCKDRFQSASPVSVLESSASSGSTRAGNCADNNAQTNHHQHSNLLYRELSVPGRARSKRARTGGRVWGNSRILAAAAAASSASTTDTESLSSDSNVISGGGVGGGGHSSALSADSSHEDQEDQQQHSILLMMTPPPKAVTTVKKPWKATGKSGSGSSNSTGGAKKGGQHDGGVGAGGAVTAAAATQSWRCLHCATQRTPQWRAGPMGPKTLCNACGVRYKSGRLLPEYRPAGSPGYVGHKHSNSHKKILEMRRQRENGSAPVQEHNNNNIIDNNQLSHLSQSPCSSSLLEEDPAGICTSQN